MGEHIYKGHNKTFVIVSFGFSFEVQKKILLQKK